MKKLLMLLLFSAAIQAEIKVYDFKDPVLEQRYQALTEELRCLVCQNQNIADSHAELAQDLRTKVYEMLNKGDSNEQIVEYMTNRYGDFVLYRPPVNTKTLVLWLTPILTLAIGGCGFWFVLKRRRLGAEQFSDADRRRIQDLLEKSNKQ
ncbi:MAG: cytochrome c-type biogenesis protein [Methylococcales bacterium]